jgi:hypothetical protein
VARQIALWERSTMRANLISSREKRKMQLWTGDITDQSPLFFACSREKVSKLLIRFCYELFTDFPYNSRYL